MKNKQILYAFLMVILIQFSTVNAENIVINTSNDTMYVYDDFDIVGNTLLDNDNGISGAGWSDRWQYTSKNIDSIGVNQTGMLNYPASSNANTSGGNIFINGESGYAIERRLTNTYELLGSTFYVSLLARKDANGAFRLEAYGEDHLRYGVRIGRNGSVEVRASTSWGTPSAQGVFGNNETYLLVLGKQGNNYQVALFKEGDAIPDTPDEVNWIVSNVGKSGVELDRFKFALSSGNVQIDELRLGSTFRSVCTGTTWRSSLNAPSDLSLWPDTIDRINGKASVQLSWTDNSDAEDGFKIFQDGREIASLAADVSNYNVSHEFLNYKYYFNVCAFSKEGLSAKSNTAVLSVKDKSGITQIHPVNNDVLYQTIPYFSWSHKNEDPFSGNYEIRIDDDSDFSSPIDIDKVPAFINYYSPDFELEHDLDYYWQVRFVDRDGNSESGWSLTKSFSIAQPETTIDVMPGDGWDEIRAKWQSVLTASKTSSGAVELRFPENGVFNITQDPISDESDRSNGFLLYVDGYDNVLVNGRGSKIIIEATHGEWLCGFMEVNNSTGMQVKDIIIDYHPNSLYQIGGVVKNFNKEAGTFDVIVDTDVYQTYEVLKDYTEGYFLSKEHQQKIGLKGVHFQMEQTWEQARVNDTTFRFTCGSSEYNRYKDELEDGDLFVLSHRGGDVVYLPLGVDNFALNNITTHACRGRFFAIGAGCSNSRCLNNNYLRTQGRIMGSSSGGVGVDRGDNIWYEGNRYEYTRDDMFHNGSNAGKGSVFRRNSLIGAYRNSIWVQADRTWVAENAIEYAGSSGIHIGYAPTDPATMPNVVLVEGNTIKRPAWRGIRLNTNIKKPDWETGSIYNENIVIRNNHIIDNYRDEAIAIDYAKNLVLENNLITNTIDDWSVYSENAWESGIHISNSVDISGNGNQVLDTRIATTKFLLVEDNCSNVDVTVDGSTKIKDKSINSGSLKVYPNPSVTGLFCLSVLSDYNVFSIDGKNVGSFVKTDRIDLSRANSGLYIVMDKKSGKTCKIIRSGLQ